MLWHTLIHRVAGHYLIIINESHTQLMDGNEDQLIALE